MQNNQYLDLASVDMKGEQETITKELFAQMTGLGFLLVSNIDGYNEEQLLYYQKWFFNLDDSIKKSISKNHFNSQNPNFYRGYAPFIANDPSHKELYEIGLDFSKVSEQESQYSLHEQTPWPAVNGVENFIQFMQQHYDVMHKLGIRLMSHIALGLGKPVNFFESWFLNDTCSTFRIIHYLPRIAQIVVQDKLSQDELKLTTPIHTDSGFLTLLSTFNYPGLQVNVGDDVYKSVRPVPKTIVVNLGDMLSRITNGKLKATKHRVLDIGVERYSSPYFFEPHYGAQIPQNLQSDSSADDGFIYGDWLIEKHRQFAEFKDFQKIKKKVI